MTFRGSPRNFHLVGGGSRCKALVRGLGDIIPQKLKQFACTVYQFWLQKRSKFENFTQFSPILDQSVSRWGLSDILWGSSAPIPTPRVATDDISVKYYHQQTALEVLYSTCRSFTAIMDIISHDQHTAYIVRWHEQQHTGNCNSCISSIHDLLFFIGMTVIDYRAMHASEVAKQDIVFSGDRPCVWLYVYPHKKWPPKYWPKIDAIL